MTGSWMLPVAFVVFCAVAAQTDEHRDARMHYVFQLPDGWTKLPAETIELATAMGKEAFDTGYQPADQLPGQFPFFVVQPTSQQFAGFSLEDIARGLARANPIGMHKEGFKPFIKNARVASFDFDKTKKRVVIRIELTTIDLNATDERKVRGISYGMIGDDAIVWLHCYALEQDFERYSAMFNGAADSFRYDNGHEFVQGRRRPANPMARFDSKLAAAIFLVLFVGAAVLVRKAFRKSPAD